MAACRGRGAEQKRQVETVTDRRQKQHKRPESKSTRTSAQFRAQHCVPYCSRCTCRGTKASRARHTASGARTFLTEESCDSQSLTSNQIIPEAALLCSAQLSDRQHVNRSSRGWTPPRSLQKHQRAGKPHQELGRVPVSIVTPSRRRSLTPDPQGLVVSPITPLLSNIVTLCGFSSAH